MGYRRSFGLTAATAAALVAVAVSVAAPAAGAPVAAGAPNAAMSLNSTWVAPVHESLFHASDGAEVTTRTGPGGQIEFVGDTADVGVSLTLWPPAGQRWHAGRYVDVVSGVGLQSAASARLIIGSTGQTVPAASDLDVRDVATASDGTVTAMDVVVRLGAARSVSAFFGEFRFNQPVDAGAVVPSAWAVTWPAAPVGSDPVRATERLYNRSGSVQHVGLIQVTGTMSTSFPLVSDACSGRDLAVGATCDMVVGFRPAQAGPVAGRLVVPIGSGLQRIDLGGSGDPGNSGFRFQTGNGPVVLVNSPSQIDADVPNASALTFGPSRVYADPAARRGITVRAPFGAHVTPGVHTLAVPPSNGYELDGFFDSLSCTGASGTVSIARLITDASGRPSLADISWNLHCDGDTPVTGRLLYRYRTDLVGPGAVSRVGLSAPGPNRRLSWGAPSAADYDRIVVRLMPGSVAAGSADSGYLVTAGQVHNAVLPTLRTGATYTLLFFSVDRAGNVSAAGRTTLTG